VKKSSELNGDGKMLNFSTGADDVSGEKHWTAEDAEKSRGEREEKQYT
jgi:hypothetical protein